MNSNSSARVPFMPQRPNSRQQLSPAEPAVPSLSMVAHDSFRPNGLLSGPQNASNDSATSKGVHIPTLPSAEAALKAATNRPLNLSGLAKRKPVDGAPGPTRKSFEAAGSRSPKSSFPPDQAQRLSASRPSSPFFPSSSGFVSMNGFRPPILPVPSKLQTATSGDELTANHAHIANSPSLSVSASAPDVVNHAEGPPLKAGNKHSDFYSLSFNPAERDHARPCTISHPSLEKIHEADEEDEDNVPEPRQRQRLSSGFDDTNVHQGSGDVPPEDTQQGLRRSTKRIHQDDVDEEELTYSTQAKRYKQDGQDNFAARYSRGLTPDIRGYAASEGYERMDSQPERPYSRASDARAHAPSQSQEFAGRGDALYRLLGQELDVFVDGHVETYEEAKKKWSECSIEEWRAGADELTAKFAKMLDFVKDHMSTKLGLYASLHSAVASHRSELSEREKVLSEARENLVREGGAVVGGGTTGATLNDT